MSQSWAFPEEPSTALMPRTFISALVNNTPGKISNRFSNHTWLCFPQLKWQNQKWCSHLTEIYLSIVIAEVLIVSINVITAMHSSLTCFFKTGAVVHGILTAECYCSPQCCMFWNSFYVAFINHGGWERGKKKKFEEVAGFQNSN